MSWTHHRARVAALTRDRSPDDPELVAARHELDHAVALRAIDDPAELARAVRIIRTALERERLSLADLAPGPGSGETA
jgi:hypothetical protein